MKKYVVFVVFLFLFLNLSISAVFDYEEYRNTYYIESVQKYDLIVKDIQLATMFGIPVYYDSKLLYGISRDLENQVNIEDKFILITSSKNITYLLPLDSGNITNREISSEGILTRAYL